ncbi:peptidyl-Lys metalloendopeptidase [Trametes punicea]|nr:peptidyl-Lys metalloendopeptidase [Trametes punicea]
MFACTVRTTLVAVAAFVAAVSAERGLSLKTSGPSAVNGVDNLKIVTTLTNTGNETMKLLNDPRGALHMLPTNTFNITKDSGESPGFIGAEVKYILRQAAKSTNPKAFTVLAPGKSASVTHDLSAAYNFTHSGAGKYTIEPSNLFHYVDPETQEPKEIRANTGAHVATVSGKLAVARPTPAVTKREHYHGCSPSEEQAVAAAAPAAQTYVAHALAYLENHTGPTPRYTTWFGAYTTERHSIVRTHFTHMDGNDFSSFTYDCSCDVASAYAYVYPDRFGYIYLCDAFWKAPTTGTDSQGGTLVHESSHFIANAGTKDYVYGQSAASSLAKNDPEEAIMNADNHEYFAENNPALP